VARSKGGIEAARQGNHAIMAPTTNCYLDYYQTRDTAREPLAIGGYLPVEKVYELDPYEQLTPAEQACILGVQANLWTEYIATWPHAEYMLLPRLSALAEVGWSLDRKIMPAICTVSAAWRGSTMPAGIIMRGIFSGSRLLPHTNGDRLCVDPRFLCPAAAPQALGDIISGFARCVRKFLLSLEAKSVRIMDLKYVRSELRKLSEIVEGWNANQEIGSLERDLVLDSCGHSTRPCVSMRRRNLPRQMPPNRNPSRRRFRSA